MRFFLLYDWYREANSNTNSCLYGYSNTALNQPFETLFPFACHLFGFVASVFNLVASAIRASRPDKCGGLDTRMAVATRLLQFCTIDKDGQSVNFEEI